MAEQTSGEGEVHEASMWYAYSCGNNTDGVQRRDFRIMSLDQPCGCGVFTEGYCMNLKSFWTRVVLEREMVNGKRTYRAQHDAPTDGRYVAFFIDIKFKALDDNSHFTRPHILGNKIIPVDKPGQLEFTTEVSVWPNTFPFPPCEGAGCDGPMV